MSLNGNLPECMNVLELFSGIGGMHFALKDSQVQGEIVEAIDINTTANEVYHHNFPNIKLSQNNIQALTAEYINKNEIDMILMSPPCQPFTRQGKKMDTEDSRCKALLHLITLMPQLSKKLKYILLENVEGFQNSDAHHSLISTLKNSDFHCEELLISPKDFGIPNSRSRYYLLAKRKPCYFSNELNSEYLLSNINTDCLCIGDSLEISDVSEVYESYLLSDNILIKRAWILDIVTKDSKRSCCFTRGYTHYIEGTGSVYCPFDDKIIKDTFEKVKNINTELNEEKLKLLKSLRLRFFTPREVANLMCFPSSFSFPESISLKQKYKLLGNSINVKVVSKLIQFLCNKDSC